MKEMLLYIVLIFFLLGGVGIYLSGKRQDVRERKKNWLKYFTYLFIVAFLYGCICFAEKYFPLVCLLIVFAGFWEIINLQRRMPIQKKFVFYTVLPIYLPVSVLFLLFSSLPQTVLLFTLLTVCAFDAFCQIAGQLFGKRKICPRLSPNKTFEGLMGGFAMSVGAFLIIGKIFYLPEFYVIVMGLGICFFAFAGDLSASWIKRRYGVKDFSSALPEHGGFLDRFDSFIASGAFVYLFNLFFQAP
jgi:phosphatidate cytidylyltransferase